MNKFEELIGCAALIIFVFNVLTVIVVLTNVGISSLAPWATFFSIKDRWNFLAGLHAVSAIACALPDYFNPPRSKGALEAPNLLSRYCAGSLGILSGIFWMVSSVSVNIR